MQFRFGYDDQDNIKKSYIPSVLLDRKSNYIFNDLKNILDINKNIYDKQFHDKNIKFYYRNMLNTLFYNE